VPPAAAGYVSGAIGTGASFVFQTVLAVLHYGSQREPYGAQQVEGESAVIDLLRESAEIVLQEHE
jgi:hypothetical protein